MVDDVEPVVEVLAEAPLSDLLLEVLVRRGDERGRRPGAVASRRAAGSSAPARTRRSLAWSRERHLADLVEEKRPAVGRLEEARLVRDRAGERAALVAEELAFEQRLGDRRRS